MIKNKKIKSGTNEPLDSGENLPDRIITIRNSRPRRLESILKNQKKFKEEVDNIGSKIEQVSNKINNSPALNGGFDRLMLKVYSIEDSIDRTNTSLERANDSIDKLKDSFYDPDIGVYRRIDESKLECRREIVEIDKKIDLLASWKDFITVAGEDKKFSDRRNLDKIELHEKKIDQIESWKSNISSLTKWTLVTLGGSTVTMLFKIVYDIITK